MRVFSQSSDGLNLTFPYWHEYSLQAPRPSTNPQLFELVSRDG